MKRERIAALALAMVLAAGAFSSCGKNEDVKKNDTKTHDDSQNSAVSETDGETNNEEPADKSEVFELPDDVRFDGDTFHAYIALSTRGPEYKRAEETGDMLNDAIFARNERVKARLGIDLDFVVSTLTTSGGDQQTETQKISSLILAGDTTYDAYVHVQHSGMPGLISEGMFIDWNSIPYINLDKAWWYSNTKRDINFGNKVFCMTGDYNLSSFSGTECLAFNKTMLDELELEYPYQSVFDGTWTHDKFVEYINAATKDLNGDGQMDTDNDRYGFGGWQYEQIPALYIGYGGQTLKKDDNDMPVLNIYSVQQNNVIDKAIEVVKLPGTLAEGKTYGLDDKMFEEGRLLFNDSFLGMITGMRNYEDDIGFIPYPKLDEAQESYYSRTGNTSCLTYLPITLSEDRFPLVGATLESMAYYSHVEVLPKYFDTILTVQSTRDVESEQMIPIIKNSSRFNDEAIGFSAANIILSGQNTLASQWMASRTLYEEKLATLIKTYK